MSPGVAALAANRREVVRTAAEFTTATGDFMRNGGFPEAAADLLIDQLRERPALFAAVAQRIRTPTERNRHHG